jgi:tetratricopeptide (TPR) repeat protein
MLAAHLEQLLAAQLITAVAGDAYAFRHALTREAVYATLLRRERRAAHLAVGEALEALHGAALDDHLADLAYHFHQAGAWDKALAYARQAGEQAQRRFAPHEAREHYTLALEAAHRLSPARRAPPELYRARGQVYELLGDFDGALADHEAALAAAQAAADPRAEWQTLLDLGLLWAGRDYEQTAAYYRRAVDLARALNDPAPLGHSLNRLGNWHLNRDEISAALALHQEALALFETTADRRGLAETLDLLGLTVANNGDAPRGQAYYTRALALFRELDDRRGQSSSLAVMSNLGPTFVSDTTFASLTAAQSRADATQGLQLARAIRWRAGEAYAWLALAMPLLTGGDFAASRRAAEQGHAIAAEIGHHQWLTSAHLAFGLYHVELGAFDAAREYLQAACQSAARLGSVLFQRFCHGALASACVAAGDLHAAVAALTATPALPPASHTPATQGERSLAAAWAELSLAQGNAAAALEIVERMAANTPHVSAGAIVPRLWLLRGRALAALGQLPAAEAVLRAAFPAAQDVPVLGWRLHAALAHVLAAQGQSAAAEQEAEAARGRIHALAATIPELPVRNAFVRTALGHLPAGITEKDPGP